MEAFSEFFFNIAIILYYQFSHPSSSFWDYYFCRMPTKVYRFLISLRFLLRFRRTWRKPNRFKSEIKSFRVTLTSSYIAASGESIRPQTKQTQSPKMSVLIFTCLDHVILLGLDYFCVCSWWLELLALAFLQSQISFFIILNLVH